MSTEWKPGDAVVATVNGRPNVRLIAGWSKYDPQLRWGELSTRWADGDDDECWFLPYQVTDHRPLVVIDPEDREQVERLADLWGANEHLDCGSGSCAVDTLQTALREYANPKPPKPEEPTGLGAVVEDLNYTRWTRVESGESETRNPWYPAHDASEQPAEWDDIAAVRVLSEGVQP